jgi:hypothetical protein
LPSRIRFPISTDTIRHNLIYREYETLSLPILGLRGGVRSIVS